MLGLLMGLWATLRFSLLAPDPPANPENICEIFREHPVWYDYANDSRQRWGTPIATQLAFVYYESSFRSHARPPRTLLWGFIPWTRPTTAYGYAQALDPAWREYLQANGEGWFTVRTDMEHALDFVGTTTTIVGPHGEILHTIPAARTKIGTTPPGSMWTRNPIPDQHDQNLPPNFPPPVPGWAGHCCDEGCAAMVAEVLRRREARRDHRNCCQGCC